MYCPVSTVRKVPNKRKVIPADILYPTPTLGEFVIPEVKKGRDWVDEIRYVARPPLLVRGALNPWQLERTREMWTAEEAAWKKIVPLRQEHKRVRARLIGMESYAKRKVGEVNCALWELNELSPDTARKMAFTAIGLTLGNIPVVGQLLKIGLALIGALFDRSFKKKVEKAIEKVERLVENVREAIQEIKKFKQEMVELEQKILQQAQVTSIISTIQQQRIGRDLELSRRAYKTKQELEKQRAQHHREAVEESAKLREVERGGKSRFAQHIQKTLPAYTRRQTVMRAKAPGRGSDAI